MTALSLLLLLSPPSIGTCQAEEGVRSPVPAASPGKRARSQSRKKGPRLRERETEGTEAADRFEADTVIKSKYQLNGEQLEVDPD
jgi:hypothetical protein